MAASKSLMRRIEDYKASKGVVFWACAGCVVATMIIGFNWGGWVTGGTASEMATKASTAARAELAAAFCVDSFAKGPDASAKLVSLKGIDSWKRRQFIEDGGWATMPGADKPIDGAAALCADGLIDGKPAMKAAATAG
jgi:hypothetical protein